MGPHHFCQVGFNMHESTAKIELCSEGASIYYGALKPEEGLLPGGRSLAHISLTSDKIMIWIEAKDITALRAAVNSFIRWYIAVMRCIGEVVGVGHK